MASAPSARSGGARLGAGSLVGGFLPQDRLERSHGPRSGARGLLTLAGIANNLMPPANVVLPIAGSWFCSRCLRGAWLAPRELASTWAAGAGPGT